MGLRYRLSQLWWNLTAGPLPEPFRDEIAAVLTHQQRALFSRFDPADQWHGYRVYRMLKQAGETESALLTAALLHDVGKTRVQLSAWDRMLVVVACRLMPSRSETWGQGEVHSWRRPFVVRSCHPQWGAEMARAAGASDLAVRLIARHQGRLPNGRLSYEDELLIRLRRADDQN